MNAQLLTMVGIFTALAFLLFGGISSIESILSDFQGTSLLKLLIVGCIWGLGLLNVTCVFLFCVGKMTKLNFKSTMSKEATFWQRYPVVCWADFVMISIFGALLWFYCCLDNGLHTSVENIISWCPLLVFIIGDVAIIIIVILGFVALVRKTKAEVGDEDE